MEEVLSKIVSSLRSCPQRLHCILGNESCDLDSAVSALVYATFLHLLQVEESILYVPLLNIPRADFPLRTEVTHWLIKHGIQPEFLVFRDEINLLEQKQSGRLELTLVDHNILPACDKELEDAVVSVIDHHQKERQSRPVNGLVIEPVGSCCTLVAEQMMKKNSKLINPTMASLLYGTIILDTVNLNEAAKRVTPKDREILGQLEPLLVSKLKSEEIFTELTKAKANIANLTREQLLRKDLKVVTGAEIRVGMASVPMLVKDYLEWQDIAEVLKEHSRLQKYDILIMMGININAEVVTRDIGIFSEEKDLMEKVVQYLKEAENHYLQLKSLPTSVPHCLAFDQGNSAASRKVVLPIVKQFLGSLSL